MKDLVITLENKTQRTRLYLNWELRMIEEETFFTQKGGNVSKCSLQRDIYDENTSDNCMKIFFNSQLNALTEFYRVRGEFQIKL